MHVELRPLSDIHPYENNPRQNDAGVDAVAASIREFGFRQPIVVDTQGVIIVGHTRYKAALQLGLDQVPTHVATELTPTQTKAYRIADNQTANLSAWDTDLLPIELAELQDLDFDLSLTGFSSDELLGFLNSEPEEGLTDPDDVPELPQEPTTQHGDVWTLGSHRLLCGDAGNTQDLDHLLDGASVHLVHTDPPYNVAVQPRLEASQVRADHKPATKAKHRPIANDAVSDAQFQQLLVSWFGNAAHVLEPGRAFYVWGGYANCGKYPRPLAECGLYFSQAIIWVKEHPVLTRKDFMGNHEWCFYGWREGAAHKFFGPANVTDVWSVKKVSSQKMVHLTEKPVELASRAITYSTRPGEHVLDLFGGSGSTLIAAEQFDRKAFVMEIDPLYCDVIVTRWEKFTGQKATRESVGA